MYWCRCVVLYSSLWFLPSPLAAQPLPRPDAAPAKRTSEPRPPANTVAQPAARSTPARSTPAKTPSPTNKATEEAVPLDFSQSKRSPYWDRPYLFAAYLLVWWVFFFYLVSMRKRQREVQAELQRLQQALDDLKLK